MAPRKQAQKPFKVNKGGRAFMSVFIVIFLIAFLLRFDLIAEAVGSATNTDPDDIKDWAGVIMYGAIGTLLVLAGLAIPFAFLSAGILLIGAVFLVVSGVKIWNLLKPEKRLSGVVDIE